MTKILKQILIFPIFILLLISNHIFPVHVHADNSYKFPWRAGEIWDTKVIGNRDDYGVHTDNWGYAMDFYVPDSSKGEVLAPASGTMYKGCTANGATYVRIDTEFGDTIRLLHLQEDSVTLKGFNNSRPVKQGEVIGLVTGAGRFASSNCQLNSDARHVHMSWERKNCNFNIEGQNFNCEGMRGCSGTYWVKCNKKYLNQNFISTNQIGAVTSVTKNNCEELIQNVYTIGENGEKITNLQNCLKKAGFYNWPHGVTGYFGNYTAQKLVDARNALKKPESGQNSCDNFKNENFVLGEAGERVSRLQNCLKNAGKYNWPHGVTGYFGNYTLEKFNEWKGDAVQNQCGDLIENAKKWQVGRVGDDVRNLQNCLKNAGKYNWPHGVTGYFGNYTKGLL